MNGSGSISWVVHNACTGNKWVGWHLIAFTKWIGRPANKWCGGCLLARSTGYLSTSPAMQGWAPRWFSGNYVIPLHVHGVGRRRTVDTSGHAMPLMLGRYGYCTSSNSTPGWNSILNLIYATSQLMAWKLGPWVCRIILSIAHQCISIRCLCIRMQLVRPTCWRDALPKGGQRLSLCTIILSAVSTQAYVGQLPFLRSCVMLHWTSGSSAMDSCMPKKIRSHCTIWLVLMLKSNFNSNRQL